MQDNFQWMITNKRTLLSLIFKTWFLLLYWCGMSSNFSMSTSYELSTIVGISTNNMNKQWGKLEVVSTKALRYSYQILSKRIDKSWKQHNAKMSSVMIFIVILVNDQVYWVYRLRFANIDIIYIYWGFFIIHIINLSLLRP